MVIELWKHRDGRKGMCTLGTAGRALVRMLDRGQNNEDMWRRAAVASVVDCLARDATHALNHALVEAHQHLRDATIRCGRDESPILATLRRRKALEAAEDALARAEGGPKLRSEAERADWMAMRAWQFLAVMSGIRADRLTANLVSATGHKMTERRVRYLVSLSQVSSSNRSTSAT